MGDFLSRLIDLFYVKPLRRLVPHETFRYAATGGLNMALDVAIYFVMFHYVLQKQDTSIFGLVVVSAPVMAFAVAFAATFVTGFWLTRTLAFGGSKLCGATQLFRYAQVVALNLLVNYLGIKLLVDIWDLFPTPSYLFLKFVTIAVSYVASKYYTFRK